jgi:hypothetical protein
MTPPTDGPRLAALLRDADLDAVTAAIKASPPPVIARATIALARAREGAESLLQATVRAGEAWALCPCKACDAKLLDLAGQLPFESHAAAALGLVAGWPKKAYSTALAWSLGPGGRSRDELLTALRAELVPWLLGEGDPLRARASAPVATTTAPVVDRPALAPPPIDDGGLREHLDVLVEQERARETRIRRGRPAPPTADEIVDETLATLARRLGEGFAATRKKKTVTLSRALGEWTEALPFTSGGELDATHGLSALVKPKALTLSHPGLGAFRTQRGGEASDVVATVKLRIAGADVADPFDADRFVDEVGVALTKLHLPRLARLRDPAQLLQELLASTKGARGFSAADAEAVAWLAGGTAAREYVARWRTAAPDDLAHGEVSARLGLR